MPEYTIRDPKSGRTVTVRGDSPPTEQELEEIFAATTPQSSHDTDPASGSWNMDLIGGARAGIAKTIVGTADLARRGVNLLARTTFPGASDPLPNSAYDNQTAKALMEVPPTWPGTIGNVIERGAEFAVPLTKVARAAAPLSIPARMGVNATAGGSVAALQTGGDPVDTFMGAAGGAVLPPVSAGMQAIGGGVKRAASGAAEGGVGGALAAVVRGAAPEDPKVMVVQALKPRSTLVNFEQSLDRALPEIKAAEAALGRPIGNVDDLLEATKLAKQGLQRQLGAMRGPLNQMGAEVDLSSVADAAIAAIPKKLTMLQPDEAAKLAASVEAYRKPYSLEDAETFLRETNAELDSFYAQYPGAQRARLTSNPEIAMREAQARALRDAIYRRLDAPGGGEAARELNRRYGALLDVEGEVYRRSNVAKRQQPESLSEQIGTVRAAGQIARGLWRMRGGNLIEGGADIAGGFAGRATAKSLKESQTTDALIKRAFAKYATAPTAVPMPSHRPARGLLGPGPIVTPPPADASFVRSVPAMRSHSVRPALPPGRAPIITEPPSDTSAVRSVPAAPMSYNVDPTITVRAGGFKVTQYASDPAAAAEALLKPDVQRMLGRMKHDLEQLVPQRGRLVRGPGDQAAATYARGGPGSPVGDDIRVISEQNVSNQEIKEAIEQLLAGEMPTNRLHTAVIDAAEGYLEKRSGYRGPSIPDADAAVPSFEDDDGFAAFSQAVDDLADEP